METVVGLLFLLGVSSGSNCDCRQDGAQCYGALGGSVVLQLMDSTSERTGYDWKKNTSVILKWRNNAIVSNTMEKRSTFFPSNGTLVINKLIRSDSGEYTIIFYNSEGHEEGKRTLQLTVQDKLAIIGGVCSVFVILLVVAITVVWVKRKKLKSQEREEDQELTYADVRILPQKERQVEKTAEVEYGQVKFPQQPPRDS